MDVKVAGFIEESHENEEGHRVIDKFKIEHVSLVPDKHDSIGHTDENDRQHGGHRGTCNTCPEYINRKNLYAEFDAWDKLSDEALENFEKLIDESIPSTAFLTGFDIGRSINETFNDWIDWLMGR